MIKETAAGTSVNVSVQPRAGKNAVVSFAHGVLKVKIKATAHDGEANKELIDFLADFFGIAKSRVVLLRGVRSRQKIIFFVAFTKKHFLQRIKTGKNAC